MAKINVKWWEMQVWLQGKGHLNAAYGGVQLGAAIMGISTPQKAEGRSTT